MAALVVRWFTRALAAGLLVAGPLGAQGAMGTVSGTVIDSTSRQPIPDVTVSVPGTQLGAITRQDGSFSITSVPEGARRVRASRIGYAAREQEITVIAGGTTTVNFTLGVVAAKLTEVVVTGYGTQRREAITGSVATVDADEANVGVVPNANGLIQGRVAGVNVTLNNGEPGGGAQIRVRGGTSLSASNEPLYVIDGLPLQNEQTEASGIGIGGGAALARSPLNLINPNDIASITVLKDASATAIYGSRGANGVILIETKKGAAGTSTLEYESYVAASTPSDKLDFLTGNEYRAFVQSLVEAGEVNADRLDNLGTASTDWEDELTRTGMTQNHNLSFSGGTQSTQYRASLNYMNQQGVVLDNGFQRYQGRLNASHQAFAGRLRLGLNLTASRLNNDYLPFENTGGFEGGVFANMAIFNPTQPVTVTDPATGEVRYYEIGPGSQSARNPVALAEQISDEAGTTRTIGNISAAYSVLPSLVATMNVGVDRSDALRRSYFPRSSPVGAEWNGRARQVERNLTNLNLQTLLTFTPQIGEEQELEVVGGYEFTDLETGEFGAEGRGYITDAFSFNNLGGGGTSFPPFSTVEDSRLVSFLGRANYGFKNRYFLTGSIRRDGSSRFGEGNKWAVFPAISASWKLSDEAFMRDRWFSNLSVRAGWGLQGNQAVRPYASLVLLESNNGARYPFGNTVVTGVVATRNANPDLKWEESEQVNFGIDYGFKENRFSGSLDLYTKKTRDLLLEVAVPQPALVSTRFENIGQIRNRGFEASLDAQVFERPEASLTSGLVFSIERNEVVNLGGRDFIATGSVSGQGQTGQNAQRIIPGEPVGTFFGWEFAGFDDAGRQLFNDYEVTRDANGNETGRRVVGTTTDPGGDDQVIIGNANPDWSLGLRSNATWKRFDASWLWRAEVGRDVFNNTALVYASKANVLQDRNLLASALDDRDALREPAKYSSRWIEDGSFLRLQNITVGYSFNLPGSDRVGGNTRVYLSGDNLLLFTPYSGYDPEVFTDAGLASRGIDYLVYPRARTFTSGVRIQF